MSDGNWINELFTSIDGMDAAGFSSFLREDCIFQFGNLDPLRGANQIRAFVEGFFGSIDSLQHDISETWLVPGGAICHGTVHYVRHDKSGLSVPFSNIFKIDGGKVREYLIFADTSELYKQ